MKLTLTITIPDGVSLEDFGGGSMARGNLETMIEMALMEKEGIRATANISAIEE
jgi:hypothetical protein